MHMHESVSLFLKSNGAQTARSDEQSSYATDVRSTDVGPSVLG